MERVLKIKKILKIFTLLGFLAGSSIFAKKIYDIYPYIKADVVSELERKPSIGEAANKDGLEVTISEHLKTARDIMLFLKNDFFDDKPEYNVIIYKEKNELEVYDNKNNLIKKMRIGSGKILADRKEAFGQYVTPDGKYIIINKMDKEDLEKKFGHNAKFYGNGLLQLFGPWAPHIAIHGTYDLSKIGNYVSNGCVNVKNEDIDWLIQNIGIGTKVEIK